MENYESFSPRRAEEVTKEGKDAGKDGGILLRLIVLMLMKESGRKEEWLPLLLLLFGMDSRGEKEENNLI